MKNIMSFAFIALLGCGSKEDTGEVEEDIACTPSIEFAVYVKVYDEGGTVIDNASVSYSSEEMSGDCDTDSVGGHYCGQELPGEITVFVSAEGFVSTEETVTAEADECHVITEELDITLTAEG